jgi:penicillin-binding protein 1A
MADAYATVANGGVHVPPTAVTKVQFPDGSVVNMGDPPHKRVFTDGEAAAATDVLKGVFSGGTGTAANIGCPAAGKTGTTSNYTDAWFVGYTPKLTTSVWVGFPHSTISMNDVNGLGPGFGGTLAAPIWHDYMLQATAGYCGDFPAPNNPFSGTAFFGKYATTGSASAGQGNGSQSGSGGGNGQYTNPNLYTTPPQPPSRTGTGTHRGTGSGTGTGTRTGTGTGTGKPPTNGPPGSGGAGNGSGGTGVKHN